MSSSSNPAPKTAPKTAAKTAPKTAQCAVCGRSADPAFLPFCSKRCADVDLSRWLSGRYVVPGDPAEDENGHPSAGEEDA